MSDEMRRTIGRTILAQATALDLAIEAGNVGLQIYIARRMTVLERALELDSLEAARAAG